jgi:hypothetical protein
MTEMKTQRSPTAKKYQEEFAKEYLAKKQARELPKTKEEMEIEARERRHQKALKKNAYHSQAEYLAAEKKKRNQLRNWERWG